jgi:beta-glucosidase
VNTTRKLLAGGISLAAMIGTIAVAGNANSATSYLLVSLSADGTGSSAVWDSAGNPELTLGSSVGFADVDIESAGDSAAPADAPTFSTDNYSAGSPHWYLQFVGGDALVGYPSQAGLGTSNWTVTTSPSAACTVANPPVNVTYAAALTFLQSSACGGNVVTHAEIIAEGQSPGTSDDLSGISYNGLTLAPGPDVVTVTSPGQQTGNLGTSITPLTVSASSDKGDGIAFTAAGLPPGLSITGGSGVISGSPTAKGSFTVTVTATDNGGTKGSVTFGWTVSQQPAVTYSGTIRLYKMGLCLDDRNNSSSNGAVVQVWSCSGLPNQKWQVMSDGTIRHNGLCLDASGYGTTNGTKVQLWACTGNGNQKWDTSNFRIHYDNPAATGKVLDDTGSGGNGTQQQIWTDNGTVNQLWETY